MSEKYDGNGPEGVNTKPSNPKDAAAWGKRIAWSVLPIRVLVGVSLALAEGAWKYARHNYRVAGVRGSVYFDAVLRHLFAWWEGQDIDPASRLNHIDKAIAGLFVLRDCMLSGNWEDDRPPRVDGDWIEEANKLYADLSVRMRAEHGEPRPPFKHSGTTVDVGQAPELKIPVGTVAVMATTRVELGDPVHEGEPPECPRCQGDEAAAHTCSWALACGHAASELDRHRVGQ